MEEVMKQIAEFNKEREWDKFHTPENLAKCIRSEERRVGKECT